MQGGDGADDGGESLEDKEITTDLICGFKLWKTHNKQQSFLMSPFN